MIAEGSQFCDLISTELFLQTMIDFGCGTGRLAPLFDASLYRGVDIDAGAIAEAMTAFGDYAFDVGDEEALTGHQSDAVLFHNVLGGMDDSSVGAVIGKVGSPRVIVSEYGFARDPIWYSRAFEGIGYIMRSGRFIQSPVGEICVLDLHMRARK